MRQKVSPEKIASLGVVRTFQEASLWFGMTVLQNVIMAEVASAKGQRQTGQALEDRALSFLESAGLVDLRTRLARDISFGQGRKLGIVIALVAKPKLLMLDEPFTGLSFQEVEEVIELLRGIHREGVTLWVIDHRVPFLVSLCSKIAVLNAGEKITEGSPREIQNNEEVIQIYLGKKFARS